MEYYINRINLSLLVFSKSCSVETWFFLKQNKLTKYTYTDDIVIITPYTITNSIIMVYGIGLFLFDIFTINPLEPVNAKITREVVVLTWHLKIVHYYYYIILYYIIYNINTNDKIFLFLLQKKEM